MKDIAIYRVLMIVNRAWDDNSVMLKTLGKLKLELQNRNIQSLLTDTPDEALPLIENDMDFDAILLACDFTADAPLTELTRILGQCAARQPGVPVFLLADREQTAQVFSAELLALASEFVWIYEDSPVFIAGRIESAIERFRRQLLPPLMRAIWEYNEKCHEYSYAAPGHQGGRGFCKSPAGKKFYDFYGENLFRTDTGIERVSIGSLLDHEGAFRASEELAAQVFGADESYSVVVGTSGSNRTIMQAALAPGDIAICDRNCHKSIEQGLINTGAVPIYLIPSRNCYGIIGPVLPSEMTPSTIKQKIADLPLAHSAAVRNYAVVTNCTYDGLCYNAAQVEAMLDQSTDRIHFDEAWYAYARFNPLYADHFALRGDPKSHRGATIFATHSTHKLLCALSQASYIHVRQGRQAIPFDRLNQAYMLHSTTSPLYAICASNDIATKMMSDNGWALTQEVINEAVDFRQALARLNREFQAKNEWCFAPWQPERVTDPATGQTYDFADAPRELLCREQACWRLEPGESWHGFDLKCTNYVMLDPIKVSILAPGLRADGTWEKSGVPGALVAKFLYEAGIVPTRTTNFQLMFLFSIGITKGKWMTLLNTLLKFKKSYDANLPIPEVLPALAAEYPEIYRNMGIQELGQKMFEYLHQQRPEALFNAAFAALPTPALTPREAYLAIVRNQVEAVPLENLAGRIAATAVIPYPPGIPLLLSGERFGTRTSPQIAYLRALAQWDAEFPGFTHVTEGCEIKNGVYQVLCVKEK